MFTYCIETKPQIDCYVWVFLGGQFTQLRCNGGMCFKIKAIEWIYEPSRRNDTLFLHRKSLCAKISTFVGCTMVWQEGYLQASQYIYLLLPKSGSCTMMLAVYREQASQYIYHLFTELSFTKRWQLYYDAEIMLIASIIVRPPPFQVSKNEELPDLMVDVL